MKRFATNKIARRNYEILDTVEAGMVLRGDEVKAIRNGSISLKEGFVKVKNGEVYLVNVSIGDYKFADPTSRGRKRNEIKLLLTKREIKWLLGKLTGRGFTAVPLEVYEKNGWIKVLIGVGRGLKKYDIRDKIKMRDLERESRNEW
jgi:SsrA-binding protein